MKVKFHFLTFSIFVFLFSFFVKKLDGYNYPNIQVSAITKEFKSVSLSFLSLDGTDIQLGDEDIEEDDNFLYHGNSFSNWLNRVFFFKENNNQSKKVVFASKLPLYLLYLQFKVFS